MSGSKFSAFMSSASTALQSVVNPHPTNTNVNNSETIDESSYTQIEGGEWVDDIMNEDKKSNSQILSSLWTQLLGENFLQKTLNAKLWKSIRIWGKLCHQINISYPDSRELNVVNPIGNANITVIDDIKYAVRHAMAAYPTSYLVFLGMKADVTFAFKSTSKLLQEMFNFDKSCILMDNCKHANNIFINNNTHEPSFYVVIDHHRKCIVLSIRGSSSFSDGLTDVDACCVKCNITQIACDEDSNYVHSGIYASAKYVYQQSKNVILQTVEQYPSYNVLFTGHSLGAGVSALLGLIFKENHSYIRLKVYAFASPCIVSRSIANTSQDYIFSIAMSTDLVTRLSLESIKHFNARLDFIQKYPKDIIRQALLFSEHMNEDIIDYENEGKIELDPVRKFLTELRDMQTPNANEQLFPLGRILWYVPECVLNDDICERRAALMDMKGYKCKKRRNQKASKNENKNENYNERKSNYKKKRKSSSFTNIFNASVDFMNAGINDFVQSATSNINNMVGKLNFENVDHDHSAVQYVLCEASEHRDIFQQFVIEMPESCYAHFPQRYLWAAGTTLHAT